MYKIIWVLISFLLCGLLFNRVLGQNNETFILLEGTTRDSVTSENLLGVSIVCTQLKTGTTSDSSGDFQLKLPPGKYLITANLIGYKPKKLQINLKSSIKHNFYLIPEATQIDEVVITGESSQTRVQGLNTGTFQLNQKEINKLPTLMGERDYFKAIQLTPGIQTTGEGNAAIYVRGGGYDQNLIILNNATVYNPSHLLGFYSVFNSDVINGVKVIKSGIPAEYGNRLSSVMEFTTSKEIPQQVSIKGNVGLISSRLGVEVPIFNNKASVSLYARKIYLNTLLDGFREAGWIRHRSILYKSGYDFYDINANAMWQLNKKNKLSFSYYKGDDVFKLNSTTIELNTNLNWGNDILSLTWNKIFNRDLYIESSLTSSMYDLQMDLSQSQYNFKLNSSIHDYGFKNKISWIKNKSKITAGFVSTYHNIAPNTSKAKSDSTQLNLGSVNNYYSLESSVFAGIEYNISKKVCAYLGARYNNFIHFGPFSQYVQNDFEIIDTISFSSREKIRSYQGVDMRASFRYLLNENLSLKASFNSNQQFLHLVNASSISFPTDFWISSSTKVKPQKGNQWAVGIFHFCKKNNIETSLEIYYKALKNQIEFYKGFLNVMDNSAFDENLIFGEGRAYGAEILIRKTKGKLTGWIGYTFSKTEKSFNEIEEGRWFPAKYDKPTDLSVVMNYTVNEKWSFSMVFVYGTGSTYTPVVGRSLIANNIVNEYGKYNSARLPAYHRCDISAIYQLKKSEKTDSRLVFSVYNIYNRKNPFFVYPEVNGNFDNFSLNVQPKEVSIFPILPSVSWEFSF